MLKSSNYTDEKLRNILIKISLFCEETEIGNFVNVFNDLVSLFQKYSPDLEDLFDTATFTTGYCNDVGVLKLSPLDT